MSNRLHQCYWDNERLLINIKINGKDVTYHTGIILKVDIGQIFILNGIPWVIKSLNPITAEWYDAAYFTYQHPDVMVGDIFTDSKRYLVVEHDAITQFVANKITLEEYNKIKSSNKKLAANYCRCAAIKKHGFKNKCNACINYGKDIIID